MIVCDDTIIVSRSILWKRVCFSYRPRGCRGEVPFTPGEQSHAYISSSAPSHSATLTQSPWVSGVLKSVLHRGVHQLSWLQPPGQPTQTQTQERPMTDEDQLNGKHSSWSQHQRGRHQPLVGHCYSVVRVKVTGF